MSEKDTESGTAKIGKAIVTIHGLETLDGNLIGIAVGSEMPSEQVIETLKIALNQMQQKEKNPDFVIEKPMSPDFQVRINEPAEEIEMIGHSGECRYCGGIVKMRRNEKNMELQPDNCSCLMCGQRYYVVIPGSIEEWELNQWRQKAAKYE